LKEAEKPTVQGRPPQTQDICHDKGQGKTPEDEERLGLCEVQEQVDDGDQTAEEVNQLSGRLE